LGCVRSDPPRKRLIKQAANFIRGCRDRESPHQYEEIWKYLNEQGLTAIEIALAAQKRCTINTECRLSFQGWLAKFEDQEKKTDWQAASRLDTQIKEAKAAQQMILAQERHHAEEWRRSLEPYVSTSPCGERAGVEVTGAGSTQVNGWYDRKESAAGPPTMFHNLEGLLDVVDSVTEGWRNFSGGQHYYEKSDGHYIMMSSWRTWSITDPDGTDLYHSEKKSAWREYLRKIHRENRKGNPKYRHVDSWRQAKKTPYGRVLYENEKAEKEWDTRLSAQKWLPVGHNAPAPTLCVVS